MFTDYVDVFHGNLEYDLPDPKGVASTWFFLKAQAGNTHPGAAAPFAAPSVCAYTGGYPTGYSPYWYNYHSRPERIMDPARPQAAGFSHFHQSGTGAIGYYYNYLILTPIAGSAVPERYAFFPLENEEGSPGFYACTLGGVPVRVTAGRMACAYRVMFPTEGGSVMVDAELNGLIRDKKSEVPPGRVLSLDRGRDYLALTVNYDFPLSAYLICPGAVELRPRSDGRTEIRFGGGSTEFFLGFSFRGIERARENAGRARELGFDGLLEHTRREWETLLGGIEIDAPEPVRQTFYSSLYHSLSKPCDLGDDSPFREGGEGSAWVDIATMWDAYKAQFPLIFTLYDKPASSLTGSLIAAARSFGHYPNCLLLRPPDTETDMQARALGWLSVYDAFVRGVEADYPSALDFMEADLHRPGNKDFLEKGYTEPYPSHTWEIGRAHV
jgi:putative alpha-1,2-mannosidase